MTHSTSPILPLLYLAPFLSLCFSSPPPVVPPAPPTRAAAHTGWLWGGHDQDARGIRLLHRGPFSPLRVRWRTLGHGHSLHLSQVLHVMRVFPAEVANPQGAAARDWLRCVAGPLVPSFPSVLFVWDVTLSCLKDTLTRSLKCETDCEPISEWGELCQGFQKKENR